MNPIDREIAEYEAWASTLAYEDPPSWWHSRISFLMEMRNLRAKLLAEGCDWLVDELDRTFVSAREARVANEFAQIRAELKVRLSTPDVDQ
jgi:hypothetical protein